MTQHRKGAVIPLGGVFLVVLVVAVVFAAEIGRIGVIQAELQRSADAGALAAAWDLATQFNNGATVPEALGSARSAAQSVVAANAVRGVNPLLDSNTSNHSDGDIVVGRFDGFGNPSAEITPQADGSANAIKLCVHMDDIRNGKRELGLAKLLGLGEFGTKASATAAWVSSVRGFNTPTDPNENLCFLPFAVKETVWNAYVAGSGSDFFTYDKTTKTTSSGPDGIKELNIYPSNSAPGNFGTIDLGNPNNSTTDVKRQILYGVSASDLEFLGGKIELDANGILMLNGDTGISASIKAELEQIKGQPRMITIFRTVSGNGNNAYFTIVKFVGIRVVDVKLTGNPKHILIQPAVVVTNAVIPSTEGTSERVYSPIVLVK